jgi:hypothetical protein
MIVTCTVWPDANVFPLTGLPEALDGNAKTIVKLCPEGTGMFIVPALPVFAGEEVTLNAPVLQLYGTPLT